MWSHFIDNLAARKRIDRIDLAGKPPYSVLIDMAKADFYRLEMRKSEPSQHVKYLETLLTEKYGENGKALFDYLYAYSKSTMAKICSIAYLHKPVW